MNHGTLRLVVYDSLQDLNAYRFHIYNMNLIIDAGIGGDTEAIYRRLSMIMHKIDKAPAQAKIEVRNMSMAIQNIWQGINPEMRCFCAFIKSIDGRIITNADLTESNIDEIVKLMEKKGLKMGKVWAFLDRVKKKFTRNSSLSFLTERPRGTQ